MLKMDLGADIDDIPYLLYMTERERGQRQGETQAADRLEPLSFPSCDETITSNFEMRFKGA